MSVLPLPALLVTNPGVTSTFDPEAYRFRVANILAAVWPDVEVAIAPTSNAGQPRETLTEAQTEVLSHGRWLLSDRDNPESEDYRRGVIEMLAVQMFGDVAETERVTAHLDPWPPVDDATLAAFGAAVMDALRTTPPDGPLLARIIEAAAASEIVFQI